MFIFDYFDSSKNEKSSPTSYALEYFTRNQYRAEPLLVKSENFSAAATLPKEEKITYDQLGGSSLEDQTKIIELFTIMGSHSDLVLFFKHKSHLEKLGKEIEHVHPLKLLGIIFSHPGMKQYMDDIYTDRFKWKYFIGGLAPNMEREMWKNNLLQHIDAFAKDVKVSPENIRPFFNNRNWAGLMKYLIYNK